MLIMNIGGDAWDGARSVNAAVIVGTSTPGEGLLRRTTSRVCRGTHPLAAVVAAAPPGLVEASIKMVVCMLTGGSVGDRKRSGRRQRREPIRRMIPPTRVSGSRGPRPAKAALMPVYECSPMFGRPAEAPVGMIPLLAVLAVLHQAQSGKPVGTCVPTSHQISGALRHLGFDAEPVAACASLYRVTESFTEVSEVGVWKRPPVVHPMAPRTGT
ncbi:hypothetical protein [Micromonospora craterilacus]|uniref:hypothetical protein n=1 Tax=Micromonospora craterilacus TaxID=1655439 RepID=UPI001F29CF33|nr:hypothetical protein [Micromonospora craterilacus]